MFTKCVWLSVPLVFAACADEQKEQNSLREVEAAVGTTTVIPSSGECTRITATRLSDFHVSEYQGELAGAKLKAVPGEHLVTAVAYPMPCNAEPAESPWLAADQIATFGMGGNVLMLAFEANTNIQIEPTFPDAAPAVTVQPGTRRRTGRNVEDGAAPHFVIDGWDIRQLSLPPAGGGGAPAEAFLFSVQGQGGLTSSPRGLAQVAGTFVVQVSEPREPLRVFSSVGTFVENLPVFYPSTSIGFNFTDGIEAIDTTRFVRTVWSDDGTNCTDDGCQHAGIEILERRSATDGTPYLEVTQQLLLPRDAALPLHEEYPVAVAPLPGGRFAVTTLPASASRIVILDATATVLATTAPSPGGVEGLFATADGRLAAISYSGNLAMHDSTTGAARAGEMYAYPLGADFSLPRSLAWDSTGNQFIALSSERRLVRADAAFTSATPLSLDLSSYFFVSSIEYRAAGNQLLVIDRLPPLDPTTATRMPSVDVYDLASLTLTSSIRLAGLPLPVRPHTIAYVGAREQILSHYRKPGAVVDPIDTKVFIHAFDGSLATSFDLAPFGFRRITSVNYLAASDELLIAAVDIAGTTRFVVTTPTGVPLRSYRTDAFAGVVDVAQITSGPHAGELGAVIGEPSEFARVTLP